MRLSIVTPTYPPYPCGVGDYTHHLARELSGACDVTVLTTRWSSPRPDTGVPVRETFAWDDPRTIFEVLPELERERPDWVLIQWDPYSYGAKHAFNPYLPIMVRRLRKRLPRTRVGVVVHETFAAPSNWKRAVMTTWQRAQLLALGRASDLLVFVIESWAEKLAPWFPHAKVLHVPVGSNVPRVPIDKNVVRQELDIPSDRLVVGWLGRTIPTLNVEWLHETIRGAERNGVLPFVLHVGGGPDHAARALGSIPARITGPLPVHELSRHLSAMDIYVAPLAEGISSRRTSVIASLAHGLPLVASVGSTTDSLFRREDGRSLVLVDPARGESFRTSVARLAESPVLREELGRGAADLAARAFSWKSIATRVLDGFS